MDFGLDEASALLNLCRRHEVERTGGHTYVVWTIADEIVAEGQYLDGVDDDRRAVVRFFRPEVSFAGDEAQALHDCGTSCRRVLGGRRPRCGH